MRKEQCFHLFPRQKEIQWFELLVLKSQFTTRPRWGYWVRTFPTPQCQMQIQAHWVLKKKSKLCKVSSFQNKLLNKSKSMHLQKTTLNEGAGTKIIIWQYRSVPLAHPAPSTRRTEQPSCTSQPGDFCSWRQFKARVTSRHRSRQAKCCSAQSKSQLGTPSPPHFK